MIGTVDSSPMRSAAPAPLEDHDEHAVRRADAEQVHQRRLERHQHRAEDDREQQEREQHDGGDEPRKPVLHPVAEVGQGRGLPTDMRGRRGAGEHRREDLGAEPLDGLAGGRVLRATWSGWRRGWPPASAVEITAGSPTEAIPGSAATPRPTARRRRASGRDVDGDDQRPVDPGTEPVGDQVVGLALGTLARAGSRRPGSPDAARGRVRRGRPEDRRPDGVRRRVRVT